MSEKQSVSLSEEWKLLWDGLLGEDSTEEDGELLEPPQPLTKDQIKHLKKELSKHRQGLNRELEVIRKEMDSLSEKLETLKLVGGDSEETLSRLGVLTERGMYLTNKLEKIDKKISWIRKNDPKPATKSV